MGRGMGVGMGVGHGHGHGMDRPLPPQLELYEFGVPCTAGGDIRKTQRPKVRFRGDSDCAPTCTFVGAKSRAALPHVPSRLGGKK